MIPVTLGQIAEWTSGRVYPAEAADTVIDGPVVTDSRQAGPGGLYIARTGEHADGHAFVGSAAAAGAVAALTTRQVDEVPCVIVTDVQEAFARLATHVIEAAADLTVIGITGSSGKTTTKDLLAGVLSRHGETVATLGSLNSEVGVPLTVCRITPTTRYLVLEMGARGIGHIHYLTEMTAPRVGVVLNVGSAHVGEFGSREGIAQAKGELVEALPSAAEGGIAVLNGDDPLVAAMASRTRAQVVCTRVVGGAAEAVRSAHPEPGEVVAADMTMDAGRASFTLATSQGSAPVQLPVVGAHQVANALAVAAVATALGMPLDEVASALGEKHAASRYRMEVTDRADGVTIVNDAYNANPESMRAALDALPQLAAGRRGVLVLGEMRELGESSDTEHERVGELAVASGAQLVVAVGPVAERLAAGIARSRGTAAAGGAGSAAGGPAHDAPLLVPVEDTAAAADVLAQRLEPGDVVLIKASNGVRLWQLGDELAMSPAASSHSAGSVAAPVRPSGPSENGVTA